MKKIPNLLRSVSKSNNELNTSKQQSQNYSRSKSTDHDAEYEEDDTKSNFNNKNSRRVSLAISAHPTVGSKKEFKSNDKHKISITSKPLTKMPASKSVLTLHSYNDKLNLNKNSKTDAKIDSNKTRLNYLTEIIISAFKGNNVNFRKKDENLHQTKNDSLQQKFEYSLKNLKNDKNKKLDLKRPKTNIVHHIHKYNDVLARSVHKSGDEDIGKLLATGYTSNVSVIDELTITDRLGLLNKHCKAKALKDRLEIKDKTSTIKSEIQKATGHKLDHDEFEDVMDSIIKVEKWLKEHEDKMGKASLVSSSSCTFNKAQSIETKSSKK